MTDSNDQKQQHIYSCTESVLDRIEKENVEPKPKWYFILKNEVFWGVGIVSIIIGSCSVAAVLFSVSNSDFDMYIATHDTFGGYLLDALPFMWLMNLAIFIALGYLQIKHTNNGYKYPVYIVIGGVLLITSVGGILLHMFEFGEYVEKRFGPYIPFHKLVHIERERLWSNSNRGVIAGRVSVITPGLKSFVIKDFRDKPWVIVGENLHAQDLKFLYLDNTVRIIGIPTDVDSKNLATSTLYGCVILPWQIQDSKTRDQALNNNQTFSNHTISVINSNFDKKHISQTMHFQIQSEKEKMNEEYQIQNERKKIEERISKCKDVRPYQLITKMRAEAQY